VGGVKSRALNAVNVYFEHRLSEVPSIRAYVDELIEAERREESS
jgi:hypothetical protein